MRYALQLAGDGRIQSVTFEKYACADAVFVNILPEGDHSDYRYTDGEFFCDPLPAVQEVPTRLDRLEAQLIYTAMMTDTLVEE